MRGSQLGATPVERGRLLAMMLAGPVHRRRGVPPRERMVTLMADGAPIQWVVGSDADLKAFHEVMVGEAYRIPPLAREPKVILDLGSHVGTSVLYFRRRFPRTRIVAVEPDPINFRRLERNVGDLTGVELLQVAVSDWDGPVTFYSSGSTDSWSSSLRQTRGWQRSMTVQGRRLDTLLSEIGVERADVMKIDIEGGEFLALPGFAGLRHVEAIVGEVHPSPHHSLPQFAAILEGFRTDLPVTAEDPIVFSGARDEALLRQPVRA